MRRRILISIFTALCAAWASPSLAQDYPRDAYDSGVQPLDRILPAVRNGRPGRFYDAEGPFPDANGGYHYRIKWLTPEGRVIWLDADARSGRILGVARGDWREQGPPPVSPSSHFGGDGSPDRGGESPENRYDGPTAGPYGGGAPYGGAPGGPYGGAPGRGGYGNGWNGHGGDRGGERGGGDRGDDRGGHGHGPGR